jgi:hypothetical protein
MGVLCSSSEWLYGKDLYGVSSAGGCTRETLPIFLSFPFFIEYLSCMQGDSSFMEVSGLFAFEGVFLVLGPFPLFVAGWTCFIKIPGYGETMTSVLSLLASPLFWELVTYSFSFNPTDFKKYPQGILSSSKAKDTNNLINP